EKAELSAALASPAVRMASGLTVAAMAETASDPLRKPRREKRALISSPMVGLADMLRGSASAASSWEVFKIGVWSCIGCSSQQPPVEADRQEVGAAPDTPVTAQ